MADEKYGSWLPIYLDIGQWIHVDLGNVTMVTKIATQGSPIAEQWVSEYMVSYSINGGYFSTYQTDSEKGLYKVKCANVEIARRCWGI